MQENRLIVKFFARLTDKKAMRVHMKHRRRQVFSGLKEPRFVLYFTFSVNTIFFSLFSPKILAENYRSPAVLGTVETINEDSKNKNQNIKEKDHEADKILREKISY